MALEHLREVAAVEAGNLREAEAMGRISHAKVVGLHDFGTTDEGRPFFVMERLRGEPLSERLKRGRLSIDEAVSVLKQVASGLACAHEAGAIHRDLKPHNIFVIDGPGDGDDGAGGDISVKILDFGVTKLVGSVTLKTESMALLGTPQYMSPEQAKGEHCPRAATSSRSALSATS